MTYLNETLRTQIADEAARRAVPDANYDELKKDRAALAFKIRDSVFNGPRRGFDKFMAAVRRIEEAAKRTPLLEVGFPCLHKGTGIRCNFGGERAFLNFSGDPNVDVYDLFVAPKPFPGDHPLTAEWRALVQRGSEMASARADARRAVRAVMQGVRTVEKLLKVWPEVVELMPAQGGPAAAGLPAVCVNDVNALLGLPSATNQPTNNGATP